MTQDLLRHARITLVPAATLRPCVRNARTHSANQLDQITHSVRTFGFTNLLLIDEADMVIAGHGRLVAATSRLGMTDVPCIRVTGLTDGQKRAFILADNKLALNAGWDEAMLAREISDLQALVDMGELDIDVGVIGFSATEMAELNRLLDPVPEAEPPHDVTMTDEPACAKQGETWCIGPHRLTIGGGAPARDADVVSRLWERETGEAATLSGSGISFKETAKERGIEFVRPVVKSQRARVKAD